MVVAKARLLMCTLDLPAKAMLLNMKQFNGEYGCTYCKDKGEPRATTHLHRNWPYSTCSTPRSHTRTPENVWRERHLYVLSIPQYNRMLMMFAHTGQRGEGCQCSCCSQTLQPQHRSSDRRHALCIPWGH